MPQTKAPLRDREARNALAARWYRLVPWVLCRLSLPAGSRAGADLEQEGYLGLLRAAELFDPGRGLKFSTYAVWWIRRHVLDALGDGLIRVPHCARGLPEGDQRQRHADRAREVYYQGSARSIAARDFLDRPDVASARVEDREHARAEVARLLPRLSERQRRVIHARFWQEKTLADVGAELRLSKERIRQIEVEALARLRALARAE